MKELKELIAFRRLNKENEEVNVAYTKIATLLEVLVTLFVESVICVILGYGGWLVWRGQFNAGQLVEYIGYFEAIVWPIMAISMLIEKTSRGQGIAEPHYRASGCAHRRGGPRRRRRPARPARRH